MYELHAFRIRNLRSLADTGFITLKPINILVGRNSSGKSTFARFIPLLKQSHDAELREPLLWWGKLVDFGSFSEALGSYSDNGRIGFEFKFIADRSKRPANLFGIHESVQNKISEVQYKVTISFSEANKTSYVSSFEVIYDDEICSVEIRPDGLISAIKCGDFSWSSGSDFAVSLSTNLVPNIGFFKRRKDKSKSKEPSNDLFSVSSFEFFSSLLKGIFRGAAEKKVIDALENMANIQDLLNSEFLRSYRGVRNFGQFEGFPEEFSREQENILFLCSIPKILDEIRAALKVSFSNSLYVEPLRATANRYYRQQALSVSEVDSRGENLAMFLDALPAPRLKSFNDWFSGYLGFRVKTENNGGHVSIKIINSKSMVETNIADTGFGFSQLLPVLVQLWLAGNKKKSLVRFYENFGKRMVVIEQPELHLHPAYQDKIADIFLASINRKDADNKVSIFAETHSANLVNRLGELVYSGQLSSDDVQVIVFQQDEAASKTSTVISSFDEEGILVNWPRGFFEPRGE